MDANETYFENVGDGKTPFAEGVTLPPPVEEHRLELRALSDVQARNVRWLVPGLIPLRTLTLVAGVGGLGKSTWLAARAAEVSRGDLLDGAPGDVIIVSFEDAAEEVLRPRIEAAAGDLSHVHEVVVRGFDGIDPVRLPRDVDELERLIHGVEAKLLIIDPVVAAIDTALDAHKDQHVRSILARFKDMAESTDCAFAQVAHLNKTPSRDAYIRIGGSVAFYNASRSVVLVTEDPDEPEALRLITQSKANYSRLRPVERHRIEEVVLPGAIDPETGDPIVTSRMVFVEVAEDVISADVLAPRAAGLETNKELSAAGFLVRVLAGGDWNESAPIKERATGEGISERTLQRAMNDLGIEHDRRGFPAVTYWRLPSRAMPIPTSRGATDGVAWLSQAEVAEVLVAPSVLGATSGATSATGRIPSFGDDDYLDHIVGVHTAGQITTAEALDLERMHKLVSATQAA